MRLIVNTCLYLVVFCGSLICQGYETIPVESLMYSKPISDSEKEQLVLLVHSQYPSFIIEKIILQPLILPDHLPGATIIFEPKPVGDNKFEFTRISYEYKNWISKFDEIYGDLSDRVTYDSSECWVTSQNWVFTTIKESFECNGEICYLSLGVNVKIELVEQVINIIENNDVYERDWITGQITKSDIKLSNMGSIEIETKDGEDFIILGGTHTFRFKNNQLTLVDVIMVIE